LVTALEGLGRLGRLFSLVSSLGRLDGAYWLLLLKDLGASEGFCVALTASYWFLLFDFFLGFSLPLSLLDSYSLG